MQATKPHKQVYVSEIIRLELLDNWSDRQFCFRVCFTETGRLKAGEMMWTLAARSDVSTLSSFTHILPPLFTQLTPSLLTHFPPSLFTQLTPSLLTHLPPSLLTHFPPSLLTHLPPSLLTHLPPSLLTHLTHSFTVCRRNGVHGWKLFGLDPLPLACAEW